MRIIKFEKILDILIKFSYLAVVFLIPVYFSLILVGNNIFELNKIISFKVLIWLLFLLTAIKIVGYEYNRQYFKKVFLNKCYFLAFLLECLAQQFVQMFEVAIF